MLKYFIRYNDGDLIRPLCIILPQMIGYVKHLDSNKAMSIKVSDNKSSVKWSVLAHLKSQPRGQNFQAQNQWSVLAHIILDSTKYQ